MVIDQSGRIEETNRPTIIGMADKNFKYSSCISARDKRGLKEIFKRKGKPRVFAIVVFAYTVFLTIVKSKLTPQVLIIDLEYPGHENTIRNILITLFRRFKKKPPDIYFSQIGKKDNAHIIAWLTFTRKLKPNVVLRIGDFRGLFNTKSKKKNDRGPSSVPGEQLHKECVP